MALIHWWPLNGDTKDYGMNPIDLYFSKNNEVFSENGKIGKCIDFDTVGKTQVELSDLIGKKIFSVTGWVYCYGATSVSGKDFSSQEWANLIAFGDGGDMIRFESAYRSPRVLSFHNNSRYSFFKESVGGPQIIPASGYVDSWHHFAFCCDGSTITIYRDGTLVNSFSNAITENATLNGMFYINNEFNESNNYGYHGRLNDLRIYDHALTKKEVKEISKACILHYDFEDVSNKNLLYSTNGIGNDTNSNLTVTEYTYNGIHGYRLQKSSNNGWGSFFRWNTNYELLDITKKYSFSVDVVSLNGNDQTIDLFSANNNSNNIFFTHSYKTVTGVLKRLKWENITPNQSFTKETNVNGVGWHWPISSTNFDVFVANPKLEVSDICTEFSQYLETNDSLDYNTEETIYDSSGYGYNAISSGILTVNSSSEAVGKNSIHFSENSFLDITKNLPDFYNVTYSFWIKLDNSGGGYRSIFIPYGSPTGNGIWLSANTESFGVWTFQGGNAPHYCGGDSPKLSANTWYLYTYVFDNGVGQCYLNDQLTGTSVTYTARPYITGGRYTIGDSYNGSTWDGTPFNGCIADFKIYATSLSADDVYKEYHSMMSLDDKYNLSSKAGIIEYGENIAERGNNEIQRKESNGNYGYMKSISQSYYNANYPNIAEKEIAYYSQDNLQCSLTDDGFRIYSPPNINCANSGGTNNMWGGLVWSPFRSSKDALQKGHRYLLKWHVKGKSSRAMPDWAIKWSNYIGWSQTPDANPTTNAKLTQPANFNGEMDCYWDFTVNDDIWKTPTGDTHAGFTTTEPFLAYAGFKIGYEYENTGSLGTDVYITDLQMYDITGLDLTTPEMLQNGTVNCLQAVERSDSIKFRTSDFAVLTAKSFNQK